jgi:bifunctional aspartokinase / homoserine dehydrogenase 1
LSDAAMSMGERLMAGILAAIMRVNDIPAQPVDASKIIVTDYRFQNAQPDFTPSRANAQKIILPLLEQKQVPIVTGYIGATPEGQITTLGRGGSDYSATYFASLIDADDVWIWTDVNGVMSADPRKIKEAKVIDTISYQEVSEFAHFGAKVLHPRCVEPLITPHIPLRVCNTFNPDHPGTRINSANAHKPKHLSAVTSIDGILVFVPSNAASVAGVPPMLQLASDVLEKVLLQAAPPVITVNSHAGNLLCYVVPTTARRTAGEESLAALQAAFEAAYPSAEWRIEPISIVAAIGVVDIQQTMQVLTAVKSVRANLLAMGHGSPACCLLAFPPEQAPRVLKRLHSLAVSVQSNLPYLENDPAAPAAIPAIPNNRRRKTTRPNKRGNPPHRVIPL